MSQRLAHAPPQCDSGTDLDEFWRGLIDVDANLRVRVGSGIQLDERSSETQTRDAPSAKGEKGRRRRGREASAGDVTWCGWDVHDCDAIFRHHEKKCKEHTIRPALEAEGMQRRTHTYML